VSWKEEFQTPYIHILFGTNLTWCYPNISDDYMEWHTFP